MKVDIVNQSQKQNHTCGNCNFLKNALQTSFNDIPDPKQVECSKDGHYHNETDEACNEWNPKCPFYNTENEENNRCELFGPIGNIGTGSSYNDRTSFGQPCEPDLCKFLASQK